LDKKGSVMPKIVEMSPYDRLARQRLEEIEPGLSANFGLVSTLGPEKGEKALKYALQLACQATHIRPITLGREYLLEADRAWLATRVERVANACLNLHDGWEFRRLLEVYQTLGGRILSRLVGRGLKSDNPDIVEAAKDFAE
jgi:hypothetical protein